MKKTLILLMMVLILSGCGKKYTVTFMDEDKVLDSVSIKKGDTISDESIPEKEGYLFVSWYKNGFPYDNNNPILEDTTLVANWVLEPELVKNHTVTFNYGEYTKTQTVREGELATKPEKDPKQDKHKFIGWYVGDSLYDFDTPVTKDILIVAKFEKTRIIITYDLNGGTGVKEVEINKGEIPNKPKNPTRFGYDFVGWSINDEGYNFDKPLYSDTTIKANYSATIYVKVTFDSDGGSVINSQYLSSGSKLTNLPSPEKDGYIFKYWTYNGEEFVKNTAINKDITLVALYEKIEEETPKENEENEEQSTELEP